jgi:hypothetical protein
VRRGAQTLAAWEIPQLSERPSSLAHAVLHNSCQLERVIPRPEALESLELYDVGGWTPRSGYVGLRRLRVLCRQVKVGAALYSPLRWQYPALHTLDLTLTTIMLEDSLWRGA